MIDNALPYMPPVRYARVNGIDMAYYEVGIRDAAGGPPIVLCHGFPELAFSWRHQLKALEADGRWAIAPDQRGYGLTATSRDDTDATEDYDVEHLASDLAALLDHLAVNQAIWCGHDWGAALAWQMPLLHPDRTAGVVGLNVPFHPPGRSDPVEELRIRFGDDMYMVHFQKASEADAVLALDVGKTMQFFMRRGSEHADRSLEKAVRTGPSSVAAFHLVKMLESYDPALDNRETFLTEKEMAVFVRSFERTGFTGGINWYRNLTRNWRNSANLPQSIDVPALMIMAELDPVVTPASANGMEAHVKGLEKVLIKGSGHWTQQEKPEHTNELILDWLGRKFPKT